MTETITPQQFHEAAGIEDWRVLTAFRPSLRAFSRQRTELLAVLEALSPKDWERGGTFTGAGRPIERTVLSEADAIARHERSHVKQIARVVDG